MKTVAFFPGAWLPLAFLIGLALGFVPIVGSHLHWNVWVFIPIGGIVFGGAIALLQSWSARLLRVRISSSASLALALSAGLGFFACDIGFYFTTQVEISGIEDFEDGAYAIRDLLTFGQFLVWRASELTVERWGLGSLELGPTGSFLTYLLDLFGAVIAAWLTLRTFAEDHPFCEACSQYMRQRAERSVLVARSVHSDAAIAALNPADYAFTWEFLESLPIEPNAEESRLRVDVMELECQSCKNRALVVRLFKIERFDWIPVSNGVFRKFEREVGDTGI